MGTDNAKTVEGTLTDLLVAHGLFDNQAEAVMRAFRAKDESLPMRGRWNDLASDYPEPVMKVLWMGVKSTAVEWIDKNKPQHWARPMFDDGPKAVRGNDTQEASPALKKEL